ncbi:MAG: sel1 repeat family protein [Halobacteriovoraceae bacterium]|jgi:TPR repeat protein|nr:sel1 repeat family protein [Halobacteriovoraceae bacterium]MBT5093025.1 sel1 repeat family protein [Halobacteriovoraceae bacterium]
MNLRPWIGFVLIGSSLIISKTSFTQSDFSFAGHCSRVIKVMDVLSKKTSNSKNLIAAACNKGSGEAFYKLSKIASSTMSKTAQNHLLNESCYKGYAPGCMGLAAARGPQQEKHLKEACQLDAYLGCARLGIFYDSRSDYKNSITAFNKSCNAGDPEACYMMGRTYAKQGQFKKAHKMHVYNCNKKGAKKSCLSAGKALLKEKNPDQKAVKYFFKKACEAGLEEACSRLSKL